MNKRILGLWNFGDDSFHKKIDSQAAKALVKSAIRKGITTFDSAFSYKEADSILASALKELKLKQEDVEVISKVMPVPTLEKKVDISLKRLNRDYIDILLLHWPSDAKSIYSSLKALERLKAAAKAKTIGVSNFPFTLLRKACDDFQIEFHERPLSLIWTKDWNEEKTLNLKTLAYAPLGMGLLSGKYKAKEELKDNRGNLYVWSSKHFKELLAYLDSLDHSSAEVALSWVYSKKPYGIIQGASTAKDLELNAFMLPNAAIAKLDEFAALISSSSASDNIFSHNYVRV